MRLQQTTPKAVLTSDVMAGFTWLIIDLRLLKLTILLHVTLRVKSGNSLRCEFYVPSLQLSTTSNQLQIETFQNLAFNTKNNESKSVQYHTAWFVKLGYASHFIYSTMLINIIKLCVDWSCVIVMCNSELLNE